MSSAYRSLWISAADGLRLHAREYGPRTDGLTPVVCLPGLTHNAAAFHELALALSSGQRARRVLCVDYRGRGLSGRDQDWRRYAIAVELDDLLQVLAAAGVAEATFVGTSRGGLIAMVLAAQRPAMIRGLVLNDIGPVIEVRGLVRIKAYLGRMPAPRNYEQAVDILRGLFGAQFPALGPDDWLAMAQGTWREEGGSLVLAYDRELMKILEGIDAETPMTPLWPQFEALKGMPVLALRGANSDLLSAETLTQMARVHPGLQAVTVAGQGHPPMLRERDLVARIAGFVADRDKLQAA